MPSSRRIPFEPRSGRSMNGRSRVNQRAARATRRRDPFGVEIAQILGTCSPMVMCSEVVIRYAIATRSRSRRASACRRRLDQHGHRRLAQEADADRGERDAELACRQVFAMSSICSRRSRRRRPSFAPAPPGAPGGSARARTRRDHEVGVEKDQQEDRDKQRARSSGTAAPRGTPLLREAVVVVHQGGPAWQATALRAANAPVPMLLRMTMRIVSLVPPPPRCSSRSASATRSSP